MPLRGNLALVEPHPQPPQATDLFQTLLQGTGAGNGQHPEYPGGTSTLIQELILLIRSNNSYRQRLRTHCLRISGAVTIIRSSWNENTSIYDRESISVIPKPTISMITSDHDING